MKRTFLVRIELDDKGCVATELPTRAVVAAILSGSTVAAALEEATGCTVTMSLVRQEKDT